VVRASHGAGFVIPAWAEAADSRTCAPWAMLAVSALRGFSGANELHRGTPCPAKLSDTA